MPPRYVKSRILKPVQAFLNAGGSQYLVSLLGIGSAVAWSIASIYADVTKPGPHDPSWENYSKISARWFVFNTGLMLFLALLEGPAWGVKGGAKHAKFDLFPLFSWQVPAFQQILFFWPAAFFLGHQVWKGDTNYLNVPAHGVASLFGQQLRELVLFDSDAMMVGHHVVTMFLSAYIWWGMQGWFDPITGSCTWPEMVALNAMSVAALEAGGMGVCVWTMFESGRAFFWIMSTSHALCLGAGWYSIWLAPHVKFFYVTFVLSVPLIHGRQSYMLKEVKRGSPTGGFENHRFAEEVAAEKGSKIKKAA